MARYTPRLPGASAGRTLRGSRSTSMGDDMATDVTDVVRTLCLRLPDAFERTSHDMTDYRVARLRAVCRKFANAHHHRDRLELQFWVGADAQSQLALDSYRHFALKRMLKALDGV